MTSPSDRPGSNLPPVQYKGEPLEASRGPGLGCFWFQVALVAVLVVATPLSVYAAAPEWVSAGLLFLTIALLLVAGQTVIFLLRLVASDRREGRRRPLASRTPTVGELEDSTASTSTAPEPPDEQAPGEQGVRE